MKLREFTISPENDIVHGMALANLPVQKDRQALIMTFKGHYGHGSGGNRDARYMTAMTRAAVEFSAPDALVFDFSELAYVWGDMMEAVLGAGQDRWDDEGLPLAVVVSDRCEPGLRSLLADEREASGVEMLHRSLDAAIWHVDDRLARRRASTQRGLAT